MRSWRPCFQRILSSKCGLFKYITYTFSGVSTGPNRVYFTEDDATLIEEDITAQSVFNPGLNLLKDLPGFGLVCTWTVMAEIGDITRFPSAREFTSYCRFVPGSRDSGGKQRHRSGNKDGNRYLRTVYNQAAVIAFTRYGPVREFDKKIKRRSGKV